MPRVLPRASLFKSVEILPDKDVLRRLRDPSFNPESTILLSREGLSEDELAALLPLTKPSNASNGSARILGYDSQRVRIEAETSAPAVLMLNDTNYPGWRASVNGKPAPILRADYLFRAVLLPPGKTRQVCL